MFTFSTVSIIVIIAITFWACWRIPKPERWGFCSVVGLRVRAFFNDPFAFLMTEVILGYAIVLCVVSLAVLWSIANTSDRALQRVPEFWIFMGLLLFFCGMIPVIGLIRFIFYDDPHLAAQLYHIMFVLIILRYGIDIYACLLAARTTRADRDG
ncbi:MAG: hypothetical protein IPL64_04165 [Flavobacteriales bacterium]|nr:hypothetical protein [Flavobacteriales bacterium]